MRAEEFPDHVVEDIPLLGKQIGPERGKLPTELEEPCSTQNIVPPPPAELERTLQPELGTRTKFFTLRQVNMQQRVRTPATCYSATNCTNTPWESRRCVWRQRDNNFKRQTINFCQNCRKRLALLETLKTLPSYLQNHCSTKKKLFLSFLPGYFDILF